MAIIATALVLATVVGSNQDSAEAIDPADTDTVYIADGTNFADALMGATIASLNTSPMLGVAGTDGGDTIPGDTAAELDRLTDDKASPLNTIYIFGGTSAVSADVENQLGQWANDVQRIEGDSRWGTYQAISQLLPSAVDEAVHAQEADHATTADSATEADNADTVDGIDSPQLQLPDVLPPGRTLQGVYALNDDTTDSGPTFSVGVSFQPPLGSDLDRGHVHFITDGSSAPAECPGSVDDPQADPGHLCLYESSGTGYGIPQICDPTTSVCPGAHRLGFELLVDADGSSRNVLSLGTWAVTAP